MKTSVMYSRKIRHYNRIFLATVDAYRAAVDFFIDVCMGEWDALSILPSSKIQMNQLESMTHPTAGRPYVPHCFDLADKRFYKFPSYLRRAACMEAIGKVSSYKSSLADWEKTKQGRRPGAPKAGHAYPCLYRDNMYREGEAYTAQIKLPVYPEYMGLAHGRSPEIGYRLCHQALWLHEAEFADASETREGMVPGFPVYYRVCPWQKRGPGPGHPRC